MSRLQWLLYILAASTLGLRYYIEDNYAMLAAVFLGLFALLYFYNNGIPYVTRSLKRRVRRLRRRFDDRTDVEYPHQRAKRRRRRPSLLRSRRKIIRASGAGIAGVGAVAYLEGEWSAKDLTGYDEPLYEFRDKLAGAPEDAPWDRTLFASGFRGCAWVNNGSTLRVWLSAKQNFTALTLHHVFDDVESGDSLWYLDDSGMPQYDGAIDIPVLSAVSGRRYPTPKFKVRAWEGPFLQMNVASSFTFRLSDEVASQYVRD